MSRGHGRSTADHLTENDSRLHFDQNVTAHDHSPSPDWAGHARTALSDAGLRAGGARDEVLDLLAEQRCVLSAQQIFDTLRERGRRVGLASVYRALDVLAQHGLVHRVDVGGTASYEPADPSGHHHHHARCADCGHLAPFEDDGLEELIESIGQRLGYRLGGHDLVLHGTCPDCASSGKR
jgi:Fur family ferric uptake transcriptional regulator